MTRSGGALEPVRDGVTAEMRGKDRPFIIEPVAQLGARYHFNPSR
jgi:hypothetical protein